jgi:hypothetical protein
VIIRYNYFCNDAKEKGQELPQHAPAACNKPPARMQWQRSQVANLS